MEYLQTRIQIQECVINTLIKSKNDPQEQFTGMMDFLTSATPSNWTDITKILRKVKSKAQISPTLQINEFIELTVCGGRGSA